MYSIICKKCLDVKAVATTPKQAQQTAYKAGQWYNPDKIDELGHSGMSLPVIPKCKACKGILASTDIRGLDLALIEHIKRLEDKLNQ